MRRSTSGRAWNRFSAPRHPTPARFEIIAVINRCTDSTEAIARSHGATIVRDDSRCLAKIRNAGAKRAIGEILVAIDADSTMSGTMLTEIERALTSGRYIGGGVPIRSDRMSPGIFLSGSPALDMPFRHRPVWRSLLVLPP